MNSNQNIIDIQNSIVYRKMCVYIGVHINIIALEQP